MMRFKISSDLLTSIRRNLQCPHAFAHERVGFIAASLSLTRLSCTVLAHSYRAVEDHHYLRDDSVGAMMGPDAIRDTMSWTLAEGCAIFHVHTHGGTGIPGFSYVDNRENAKFVPDFFKVRPEVPHGAIVLSGRKAAGNIWLHRNRAPTPIEEFRVIGSRLSKWNTR